MKSKRPLLILASLALAIFSGWFFRIELTLAFPRFEADGKSLRDRLIAYGPASIGPTIATLRRESPWVRNYCYLPRVLQHFGEPAHRQLLEAIDAETNRQSRAYLISALQDGFHDFSRFDRWLADANPLNEWATLHMAGDLRIAFPDAPPLEVAGALNPDFLAWWKARSTP